ncbi:MAG: GPR endopeptidase [Eubacteriales bacterium]
MINRRTDLAQEAKEIWQESAGETTKLQGVEAVEERRENHTLEWVKILDHKGEEALGKPMGTYITITLNGLLEGAEHAFLQSVEEVANQLQLLLGKIGEREPVLVVGLGNRNITPDAIGPKVFENTAVTRHLVDQLPTHFEHLRPVSAVATGVLGTTGVDSCEMVRGVVEQTKPACIIAVDALAARSLGRVCRTVQLADTGITPGSGVGNHRGALNVETLGVPVIAIGVPTVVDGGTLVADIMGVDELPQNAQGERFFVTPKEIDSQVAELSKVVAYGINLGLNPTLSKEDMMLMIGG